MSLGRSTQLARWAPLVLGSLLVGCTKDDGGTNTLGTDTATSAQADSGSAAADETGPTDVTWALHEDFGTLIVVSWTQAAEGQAWVEYDLDDEVHTTPTMLGVAGDNQQTVLGVPYEMDTSIRVVLSGGEDTLASDWQPVRTDDYPDKLVRTEVIQSVDDEWQEGAEFLLAATFQQQRESGHQWMMIIDRRGRTVWARPIEESGAATYYARIAVDGDHLLCDEANLITGEASVIRFKLDGSVEATYDTPGLHHAFTELPDESILWGAISFNEDGDPVETLDKLSAEGTKSTLWDCAAFNETFHRAPGCASNALYYDEPSDSIWFSFFTSMTIVNIDHQTGDTIDSFGALSDWTFDPEDSAFDWQHGVTLTSEDTVLLSTHLSTTSTNGVVREYQLDREEKVLREIWNFGIDRDVAAVRYGEAHRLRDGNTIQNYGSTPKLVEITPEKDVVWEIEFVVDDPDDQPTLTRTVFIDDMYALLP